MLQVNIKLRILYLPNPRLLTQNESVLAMPAASPALEIWNPSLGQTDSLLLGLQGLPARGRHHKDGGSVLAWLSGLSSVSWSSCFPLRGGGVGA